MPCVWPVRWVMFDQAGLPFSVWTMSPNHSTIHVLRPGLFTTIQDLGRRGYQRFGVSVSGAMDPWALTVGNRLVSNPTAPPAWKLRCKALNSSSSNSLSIAITGADLHDTRWPRTPHVDRRDHAGRKPIAVRRPQARAPAPTWR